MKNFWKITVSILAFFAIFLTNCKKDDIASESATSEYMHLEEGIVGKRICGAEDLHKQRMENDLNYRMNQEQIEKFTKNYLANTSATERSTVVTIPVVVHVLYNNANQNVSDAQIQSQIQVLNDDFRRLNADASNTPAPFAAISADCEVNFCMAQTDPNGAATNGIQRRQTTVASFSTNDNMKHYNTGGLDAWPAASYLNIWVCNLGGGILGYAQFPGGPAADDGVVITTSAFGTMGTAQAPFNKGRTATHEVGHYLNLFHIWGDDGTSCSGSDNVADTPNQADENYGCPSFPMVSCNNGANGDMFMNYMDYTDDACMNAFTTGQKNRMHALFAAGGARASLLSSTACNAPTGGGTCAAPAGVSTSNITTNAATISWTAASGATSYQTQYRIVGTSAWTSSTSTSTTVTLSALSANTNYEVRVRTVCTSGNSAFSATQNFTTQQVTQTCDVPTGLSTTSINTTSATIGWTSVSGANSYKIQHREQGTSTWTTTNSITNTQALTGLSANTSYQVRVRTVCASGMSAYSSIQSFTTQQVTQTCDVPSNLNASNVTSSAADLGWTGAGAANNYRLRVRAAGTTTWTNYLTTSTNYSLSGLAANTTYQYRIRSQCASGNSAYSPIATFTTSSAAGGACSDTYEPNNSRGAAPVVAVNIPLNALIGTVSDVDFFRFGNTSSQRNIRVSLTSLAGDYDLYLYRGSNLVDWSENWGTNDEEIIFNTNTVRSNYFVEVVGYNGAFDPSDCYDLLIEIDGSPFRVNPYKIGEKGSTPKKLTNYVLEDLD